MLTFSPKNKQPAIFLTQDGVPHEINSREKTYRLLKNILLTLMGKTEKQTYLFSRILLMYGKGNKHKYPTSHIQCLYLYICVFVYIKTYTLTPISYISNYPYQYLYHTEKILYHLVGSRPTSNHKSYHLSGSMK